MDQKRIIIDEAIPDSQIENIAKLLKRKDIKYSDFFFITKEHQGMPDYQIIHFLLNESTVFFTADRPLHNTVLKKGYKSFFFNGDNFSAKPLKGVSTIRLPPYIKKDLQPKDQYHEPETEIRHLVLPKSEKSLKKLRTKRRRIKSYFGGTENMDLVAITVSYKTLKSSILVGTRIKISSNIGVKALDASESYVKENIYSENGGIIALSHALILPIQLMLNHIKTIVYYDAHKFKDPGQYIHKNDQQQYQYTFQKLLDNFPQIEFTPSVKGFFIERLRQKLDDLSLLNTNEIVRGRLSEINSDINQFYSDKNI